MHGYAAVSRLEQRVHRLAAAVGGVVVRPSRQQQPNYVGPHRATPGGDVKRRIVDSVNRIDGGVGVQQRLDGLDVGETSDRISSYVGGVAGAGQMQRRATARSARVHTDQVIHGVAKSVSTAVVVGHSGGERDQVDDDDQKSAERILVAVDQSAGSGGRHASFHLFDGAIENGKYIGEQRRMCGDGTPPATAVQHEYEKFGERQEAALYKIISKTWHAAVRRSRPIQFKHYEKTAKRDFGYHDDRDADRRLSVRIEGARVQSVT